MFLLDQSRNLNIRWNPVLYARLFNLIRSPRKTVFCGKITEHVCVSKFEKSFLLTMATEGTEEHTQERPKSQRNLTHPRFRKKKMREVQRKQGTAYRPLNCPQRTDLQSFGFIIGIKHGFPCINVCQVPREMLKTEAVGRGFQHLPRDLANVNVLESNVWSLLLHKLNDLFVKIWETIWHYILSPFDR